MCTYQCLVLVISFELHPPGWWPNCVFSVLSYPYTSILNSAAHPAYPSTAVPVILSLYSCYQVPIKALTHFISLFHALPTYFSGPPELYGCVYMHVFLKIYVVLIWF